MFIELNCQTLTTTLRHKGMFLQRMFASLHHPHPKVDGGPPSEHGLVTKLWVGN